MSKHLRKKIAKVSRIVEELAEWQARAQDIDALLDALEWPAPGGAAARRAGSLEALDEALGGAPARREQPAPVGAARAAAARKHAIRLALEPLDGRDVLSPLWAGFLPAGLMYPFRVETPAARPMVGQPLGPQIHYQLDQWKSAGRGARPEEATNPAVLDRLFAAIAG
jgi:hypothetical protein